MIGDVLNALTVHGCNPRRSGDGYSSKCPAHEDRNPSLSITEGAKGGVVLTCHAGCELDAILTALGLDREAIRPQREERIDNDRWTPGGDALDIYRYVDAHGDLLFEVVRAENKRFFQRRQDKTQRSGWTWKLGDVPRPLYRLPRILKAVEDGETILVCEGEKDVHAAERAGHVATCNPGGAGKWRPEHTATLKGAAEVIIVTDRDDTGRKHARHIAEVLRGGVDTIIRVEARVGKDAFDHFNAGLTLADFWVVSDLPAEHELGPNIAEFLDQRDNWNWLIPGLLERGDRLMLTGPEGLGKSTLTWQFAICVAAGIHPFTFKGIEPRQVLLIDCENGASHLRRKLRVLHDRAEQAGHPVAAQKMHILLRPQGLDLTREDDACWLHERVTAHRPDILILGPLYRLHAKDPNDEQAARATAMAIDAARDVVNCVVMLEAHSGHAREEGTRNLRPTGSSLWLRWPEFGFGLRPTSTPKVFGFETWRGPRAERAWPRELHVGDVWPWEGKYDQAEPDGLF